jgi:HPr kinase/phosphorylase
MFGIRAIRFQKRVELVIDMDLWDESEEYTRLQMYDDTRDFLGVDLPRVKLPITPGKNVTVICEVIAMNYLLQHYGYDPAKVFTDRLADQIKQRGRERPGRGITWFERDFE